MITARKIIMPTKAITFAAIVLFWLGSFLNAFGFTHPGIPLTVDDLATIKANLNVEPWKTGFAALQNDSHSSLSYTMQGPFSTVSRNPNVNLTQWRNDMQAVGNLSLMWYFTSGTAYAQKAHDILLAWANTQTSFGGIESALDLGDYAQQWAGGADILRGTWPGWTQADTDAVKNLFINYYWPASGCVGNTIGPANKGSLAIAASLAIAVFCDDTDKFNKVLYLMQTSSSGGFPNTLPSGEVGETGRDQGHAAGEWGKLAMAAEIFWKQGIDVFSYLDNRLLACGEYFSRWNSGVNTPFITYGTTDQLYANPDTTPWGGGMPGLNVVYNAYVVRKGMSAPYLKQRRDSSPVDMNSFVFYRPSDTSTATPPVAPTYSTASTVTTGFLDTDIGGATPAGSASYSAGTWSVNGGGTDIWTSGSDSCHFTYKQITGDCTIIAKVNTVQATGGTAKAGVMIRDSLSSTSANRGWVAITAAQTAESYILGNTDVYGGWRTASRALPQASYWVKIERYGQYITYSTSPDGASWACITAGFYYDMPSTVYLGLVVCSMNTSTLNAAKFSNVSITGGDGGAVTIPPAPYAVYASPGAGQVPLRWLQSFGATSYNVLRSTTDGGPYTTIASGLTNASYIDTNVAPNTTYYYVVTATNSAGTSANSSQDSTTTQPAPAAPTGLYVLPGNGQATLLWAASSGATSYNVKRATTSGGGYVTVASVSTPGYLDTALVNGTTYYYVVSAVSAAGEGANSTEMSVTPSSSSVALFWSGAVSGAWDTTTANWLNAGASALYQEGNSVIFDDSTTLNPTVSLSSVRSPGTIVANNNSQNYTIGGSAITGTGVLMKQGSGSLTLTGANTYSGGTTHNGGTITVGSSSALGTGVLRMNGGTLTNSGNFTVGNDLVVSGVGSAIQLGSANNLTLSGGISGTGTLMLGNSGNFNSIYLTGANTMSGGNVVIANNQNYVRFVSTVTGNANANWVFNNTLAAHTTFEFGSGTISFGSLSGNGVIQGNVYGTNSMNVTISVGANNASTTFSGVIHNNGWGTGPIGLTKVGSGTLTLTGANDYSGTTNVSAGELLISTASLASGNYTVASGATFGVANTSAASAPVSTLTVASGAALEFQNVSSTTTPLIAAGNLIVNGNCIVKITGTSGLVDGSTYPLLSFSGAFQGSLSNLQLQMPSGWSGALVNTGSQIGVSVTFVPPAIPNPPATVTATGGAGQVSLNWSASTWAIGYNVKRSLTSGTGFTTIAANVSSLVFIDSNVTSGTPYYYVVTAIDSLGESGDSAQVVSTALPSAPGSLTATGASGMVNLAWGAGAGAASYNVMRTLTSGSGYAVIASSLSGTSYTDNSVSNGTNYYYVISSVNVGGTSASSPEAGAMPIAPAPLPSPWAKADIGTVGTTGTSYYAGGNTFVVKGAGSDINGTADSFQFAYVTTTSTSFTLYARVSPPLSSGSTKVGVMIRRDATSSGARMAGVIFEPNGSAYQVRFAYRTATNGSISWSTAVTGLTGPQWIRVDRGGNSYAGYYSADGVNWTQLGSVSSTLISNGASAYAGLAVCSRNTGTLATQIFDNVSVIGWTPPPSEPGGLIATAASQTQLNLSWNAVNGASAYQLLRSNSWSGSYSQIAAPTSTSFVDTGLTANTSYYYMVRATSSSGTSGNSTVAAGTTLPYVPSVPTGLTATGSNAVVSLSWSTTSGATGYNVKRSLTSGTNFTTVASGVASSSYKDASVTNGTTYYYVVSAVNAGGESANSSQASATPIAPPSAPSGLTATGSNGMVSLSWAASTGATGYNVKRSSTNGSGYVTVAGGVGATSYNDVSVTNGTTYYYVVSAANAGGEGSNSSQVSATPDVQPSAPATLVATGSNASVVLNWSAGTGAASYNVKRTTTSGTGYVTVVSGITSTTYTDSSLLNGTAYYYVVTSVNTKGESGNSPEATATPVAPPSAPTGLVATGSNAVVGLTWNPANGAVSYNVKRSTTSGTGYAIVATGVAATSYSDSTVANGGTYYYVVSAVNAGGESAQSSQASATPVGPPTVAPSNLVATGSNASAVLNWTAATGATSYNVKRSLTSGTGYTVVAAGVTGTTYTNTGLTNGTTYYYVVSGANLGGEGPSSPEASATAVAPPSAAPSSLTVSGSNASAVLTWSAATAATSYNVKRSLTSGSGYSIVATVTGTTFTNTGLTNGTTYYYVVSGVNLGGEGPNSIQGSATPTAPPSAPASVWATAGNAKVVLNWSSATGAASYNIKRATTSGGPYTTVASGVTALSGTDTGLANDQPYYFVISAVNAGGESANSAEVTAVPNANALMTWLRLDETGGTTASDSTGNGLKGTVVGGATWAAGKINNAISLSGASNYLTLPNGVVSGVTNFTMAAWVKVSSTSNNTRIFDIGTGTSNYMELCPKNGNNGFLRYEIVTSGTVQQINTTYTFPLGAWTHVAVTLSGSAGTLYVNGTSVGTNSALTLNPANLGATTQNYIGKSQWSVDPYFNGAFDEFKIYSRALSASEIEALAAPPAAPAGVTVAPGNTQVTLTWNSVPGATSYKIQRATTSGGPYSIAALAITGTSYVDSGLTNGTTYYYLITAASSIAESNNSSEVSATPIAPPMAPTGLSWSGVHTLAGLSWNAASGATGYNLKRSLVSGSNYTTIAPNLSGTTYTDAGASPGVNYYYIVTGINVGGESSSSGEISVTPLSLAPTGLAAVAGDAQVSLSWNPSTGADSYNIKQSLSSGGGYVTIATGVGGTSFTDSSVSDGTTYFYVVTAVNHGGESATSSETYARPVAPVTTQERLAPSLAVSGSSALATLPVSVVSHTYQLQYCDDLAAGSWQNYGPAQAGTGGILQFQGPLNTGVPRRFYRILIQQ